MTNIYFLIDNDYMITRRLDCQPEEAIEKIKNGILPLPPEIKTPRFINHCNYVFVVGQKNFPELKGPQEEILKMLCSGASLKQIADVMGYSYETIQYHINKLKKIFTVGSREELVAIYLRCNPNLI